MRVEAAPSDALPEADVLAIPVGPGGVPSQAGRFARVADEEELAAKCGKTAVLYPDGEVQARPVADGLVGPAERAATAAAAANRARALANTGANDLTPERLTDHASELAGERQNLTAEALGPDEVHELGMGSFSAVAQGSHNPAR